ncbi:MAG TPA: hypothetical protein VLC98_04725 [Phnomibacter sp.]|nr:hypothetical protein [Phnomibacter sp.]
MVIGIVLPDGIGIKNYLYTEIPSFLLADQNNSIVLFHAKLDKKLMQEIIAPYGHQMRLEPLPIYREDLQTRLIRESINIGRLTYFSKNLNNTTLLTANPKASSFKRKILKRVTTFFAKGMSKHYDRILAWEKRYQNRVSSIDVSEQLRLLQQYKVDVLFSLHQRPLENIPMYEAAKRLNIRRCAVIYSWDNIQKARLYTLSEKYFLWSKFMYDQMQLFYPEIPAEKLIITGTPQFSFYFNPDYQTAKSEFSKSWRLDENRPIALYTGSDLLTAPYDAELLRDVAEAIEKMPETNRPQLIFRRTPADFSDRYNWVLAKYPWILKMDPVWQSIGNSWATVIPTKEDLKMVVSLVQHCSLVINVGSTMALDAATHHKPCIYLSYHPAEARQSGLPTHNEILDQDHFKVMKHIDAVVYVEHEDKLGEAIQALLTDANRHTPGKEKYLEIITDNLHATAAKNIADEILYLGSHHP